MNTLKKYEELRKLMDMDSTMMDMIIEGNEHTTLSEIVDMLYAENFETFEEESSLNDLAKNYMR